MSQRQEKAKQLARENHSVSVALARLLDEIARDDLMEPATRVRASALVKELAKKGIRS